MRPELKEILVCPDCASNLWLYPFIEQKGEVQEGILKCSKCNRLYPIINFIPRMLPPTVYYNAEFISKYHDKLNQLDVAIENYLDEQKSFDRLKKDTMEKFGFEWLEYSRFGWDDTIFNIQREEEIFRKKSLLEPKDLQGKLVLDAGCGNGRYSYWATQYGAKVIGVDLGYGVEASYMNTKDNEKVNIIQGDLFNLPLPKETFDIIFSIGVLMHTGNAKLAFMSLIKHLKHGGIISIHVYGKRNPIFEFNDFVLRKITTRLSVRQLVLLTRVMFGIARVLDKVNLLKCVNLFVRLENHPHCIFDWYSAPVATHHTYSEAYEWFDEFGLKVIKDNKEEGGSLLRKLMRWVNPAGSLTVLGVKV